MILVYVPCKDKKEAKGIAKELLEKRLVACANIHDSDSLFRWKGKIEDIKESILLLKTTKRNYPNVEREIKRLHSYELPCIMQFETKANLEFEKWVYSETS